MIRFLVMNAALVAATSLVTGCGGGGSGGRAVGVDGLAPSLSTALVADTGSSNSDGITSNPAIAGQASDNVGVTQLLVALDPGATPTFSNQTAAFAADGSFTLSQAVLDALAGGALADGAHTIRIVAADAAGNQSPPVDVSFTFDTSAPTLTSFGLDPASDTGTIGDNITGADTVTLVGVASPGATVALTAPAQTTTAAADGSFSFANIALVLGDNSFEISLSDAAGNTATGNLSVNRATGTVYNARLAYENLLSAPSKSFVLNGTASNGDLFTLTWTIAPQGQATFQLTNTLAQQVDSSVVIAKGAAVISSGTQQSYLTGTFIGLGSFRPADGSCSESSGQQYPTAATVGQSGSLGTSIIYGTCNKTLTDIIGSIEGTWSVETIGSITYVCSNSISKDNAGAVLSTEVNCVEFTPAGAVGTHARWTVTVQGETVVFSN